ncbi:MAG: sulfite exporter TauE/SafE family protein [Cyanobacteria bacterium M_surface_10_m2_179]|nr:sulfite exporter TauE/SafE family protein [Cyanobacteria bacterium M_surface_10_m2_179]
MPWDLLPLLPLGILAGLLSGLLGIGGGLIFSPLLLALGLSPHQALATSTLAILPTTMAGSWAHLRSGLVPPRSVLAIAAGAIAGSLVFSHAGSVLQGWQLLSLQALMYGVLALVTSPRRSDEAHAEQRLPLAGLSAVGLVAGWASGLLGVGGGLVMVPLMVQGLGIRVYQAIRLSTLAVCASAATASVTFLGDGRGHLAMGLLLGGTAALASQWSASRLQSVSESKLVWLLRLLCMILAVDAGRRALQLVLS